MTSARWIGAAVPLLLLGALAALGCYTAWQSAARRLTIRRRGHTDLTDPRTQHHHVRTRR